MPAPFSSWPAGSGTITTLASFNGANGQDPNADLIEDRSGNLFGTAAGGGNAANDGTVFEVAAGSNAITTLAYFNGANGANPNSALIEDSSGNLFGTTVEGGASNDGTVFEVAAGRRHTITPLASFNGAPTGLNLRTAAWLRMAAAISSAPPLMAAQNGRTGPCSRWLRSSGHAITPLASFNGTNGQMAAGRRGEGQQRQSLRHRLHGRRVR